MNSVSQQPLTQQQERTQEEYLSAQRAGAEAVQIGRETLEVAERQGEQLQNAENLAEETEYKLDRATRLLRGMTWSGWFANKFSRDVEPPEYLDSNGATSSGSSLTVYENVPADCEAAAQAIQNYHANLQVLHACETPEQRETCQVICDNMYDLASREVTALLLENTNEAVKTFPAKLDMDLKVLREGQLASKQPSKEPSKEELFAKSPTRRQVTPKSNDPVERLQEEHLDVVSKQLNEMGSLATNLNTSLAQHSDTLQSLDEKEDSMLFKSKMVTRRADRLIQKKSWTKTKPEFMYYASIRHLPSGKYLAVTTSNSSLVLSSKYNETCIFGIWQRAKVFGLKSKYSLRWVGQSLLGQLVCSATSFDRREEWDADDPDWSRTTLLCASAGWGNGGYLLVRPEDHVLAIGGGGLRDKQAADLWAIQEMELPERSQLNSPEKP